MSVKGGVGKVIEYTGEALCLSVPERATITNMGAELGATTSVFPSDEITRQFGRPGEGRGITFPFLRTKGAEYDEHIVIDFRNSGPCRLPHSPDNVRSGARRLAKSPSSRSASRQFVLRRSDESRGDPRARGRHRRPRMQPYGLARPPGRS